MSEPTRVTDPLYAYMAAMSPVEDEILAELKAETAKMPEKSMQISHNQGRFMDLVIRAAGAVNTIEIGVFTGYSTLVTARALPEKGRVTAIDRDPVWTDVACRYWERAGIRHKIDLVIGDAVNTLESLEEGGGAERYDFAFIDADKREYNLYYECCLRLLRPGGLIMMDNAFWYGYVTDPGTTDPDTVAIHRLNRKISLDSRVTAYLAPVGDGIYLAVKK